MKPREATRCARKAYTTPMLVAKGNIAELTLSCTDKTYGTTDGLTFLNQPITNNCS